MIYTANSKRNANRKKKIIRRRITAVIIIAAIVIALPLAFVFFVQKIQVSQVLALVGKEDAVVDVMSEYKDEGIAALLAKKTNLKSEIIESNLDTTKPGKYTVTYKITNEKGKNPIEVVRSVSVVDKVAPTITLLGGSVVNVKQNSSYTDPGVLAIDNVDGDVTSKVVAGGTVDSHKLGEYTVTYTSTDTSGNTSSVNRSVKVTTAANSAKYLPKDSTIYLSFDDGPSKHTAEILDILKKYNIKATFFVIGQQVDGYKDVLKRAVAEGHTVGLHTYTHEFKDIYSSVDNYFADLEKVRAKVKEVTGIDTKIFRFAGGTNNTISRKINQGIMTVLDKEAKARGYYEYDWNMDSGDATSKPVDANGVFENLKSGLSSKSNRFFALMHDASPKNSTPPGVDMFIDYCLKQGYNFGNITTEVPTYNFKPLN